MVYMANQIAGYFSVYPQERARKAVADHLTSFWEPRMRAQLRRYIHEGGGEGLHSLVREAANDID